MSRLLIGPLLAWAKTLRYPTLFKITAALFVLTLFIPDPIPFMDEILLGLGTLLLANWHRRKQPPVEDGAQTPAASGTPASKPPIDLPKIR